ncbi:MAG: hypothetical protein ABR520_10275 [Mycobacteriales bacterium]|nr:hypothetical protein [Frankia sp.]MCA1833596.1 hypothetical protein [Actinomycetota bacterium]
MRLWTRTTGLLFVRLSRQLVGIALPYASALLVLATADIVLPHRTSPETFGRYQFVRQLAPLVVVFGLLGVDQVIARSYYGERADRVAWLPLLPRLARATAVVAAVFCGLSMWRLHLPLAYGAATAFSALALVVSELTAGYLRAAGSYALAAFVQQGYRILLGVFLMLLAAFRLASPGRVVVALVSAPAIVAVMAARALWRQSLRAENVEQPHYESMRRIGIPIALAVLGLGAMDWVDQAALALRTGGLSAGGIYTSAKIPLSFPAIAVASIVGFAALPEVAKRLAKVAERRIWWISVFLAAGASCAINGAVLAVYVSEGHRVLAYPVSNATALLLVAAGASRLAYVLPSAVLGAAGSGRLLYAYAFVSVGALALEGGWILLAPIASAVDLAASGLLVAAGARLIASLVLASLSLRPHRVVTPA